MTQERSRRRRCAQAAILALALAWAAGARALPLGGVVVTPTVSGTTINTAGSTTTVNQTDPRVVIDWTSFNVAAGESVNFNQSGLANPAAALAINRVSAAGLTTINGSVTAQGAVWLFTPGGLLLGPNAAINAGGFLASTGSIDNTTVGPSTTTFSIQPNFPSTPPTLTVSPGGRVQASQYAVLNAPDISVGGAVASPGQIVYATDGALGLTLLPTGELSQVSFGGVTFGTSHVVQSATGSTTGGGVYLSAPTWPFVGANPGIINLGGVVQANGLAVSSGAFPFNPNGLVLAANVLNTSAATLTATGDITLLGAATVGRMSSGGNLTIDSRNVSCCLVAPDIVFQAPGGGGPAVFAAGALNVSSGRDTSVGAEQVTVASATFNAGRGLTFAPSSQLTVSGGDANLTAGSTTSGGAGASLGGVSARDVVINSQSGAGVTAAGPLSATGNLFVTTTGAGDVNFLTDLAAPHVQVSSAQNVTLAANTTFNVGDFINLTAAQNLTMGAGSRINQSLHNANDGVLLVAGSSSAGGDLTLGGITTHHADLQAYAGASGAGNATLNGAITSDNDLLLTTGNSTTSQLAVNGDLTSGAGPLDIFASGNVSIGAGRTLSSPSLNLNAGGDLIAAASSRLTGDTVSVAAGAARPGALQLGRVNATSSFDAFTNGGPISLLGDVTGGTVFVDSGADLTLGPGVDIAGTGTAQLTLIAQGSITADATSTVSQSGPAGLNINGGVGATGGNVSVANVQGSSVIIAASGGSAAAGDITLGGPVTSTGGIFVSNSGTPASRVAVNGDLTNGAGVLSVSAGGDLSIGAGRTLSSPSLSLSAGGDLIAAANSQLTGSAVSASAGAAGSGALQLGQVNATGSLNAFTNGGPISLLGDVTGGTVFVDSGADLTLGAGVDVAGTGQLNLIAQSSITADATSTVTQSGTTGGLSINGGAGATGVPNINGGAGAAGGNVSVSRLQGRSVIIAASGGSTAAGDITLGGPVTSTGGIFVSSFGTPASRVAVNGDLTAGAGVLSLQSQGAVQVSPAVRLTGAANIDIAALGDVTLGAGAALQAATQAELSAGGTLTTGAGSTIATTAPALTAPAWPVFSLDNRGVRITAGDVDLNGTITAGTPGARADILIAGAGGGDAAIGGDGTQSASFRLSNAEIGRLTGRMVYLAGALEDGVSAGAAVTVDDLTVNGANIAGIAIGADSGHDLTLRGSISQTGSLPYGVSLGGTLSENGALLGFIPRNLIINGALGQPASLDGVNLIARRDILIGSAGFTSAAAASASFDPVAGATAFPPTTAGQSYIAAHALQLAAQGRILSEDTDSGFGFAGLRIGAPTSAAPLIATPAFAGGIGGAPGWTPAYAAGPARAALFGVLLDIAGQTVTGPLAANTDFLLAPGLASSAALQLNGCQIGACQATALSVLPPWVAPNGAPPPVESADPAPIQVAAVTLEPALATPQVPATPEEQLEAEADDGSSPDAAPGQTAAGASASAAAKPSPTVFELRAPPRRAAPGEAGWVTGSGNGDLWVGAAAAGGQ